MRVALCLAGAWRDWPAAWLHIEKFIVEPLGDVDVFAISDTVRSGAHGKADPGWTVPRMRQIFGNRFRAGERLSATQLANVSGDAWPEIATTQAALPRGSVVFSYLYKIWRCGQLIHQSGIKYDAVIRMRPDLRPTQEFRMARTSNGEMELQVGGRCVRFGTRSVVVHAYTNFCGNDWLAIGAPEAMTVTMDLIRFFSPMSGFLSPDAAFDERISNGVELAHNWLWWRTGTTVLRRPLFLELSRRKCTKPACLRMPAWQVLPRLRPPTNASSCIALPEAARPPVGTMQPGRHGLVNDCGATSSNTAGDLEFFTGPTPATPPAPTSPLPTKIKPTRMAVEPPRVLRTATPPTWTRPPCGNVPDLTAHNPLPPCKKTTGDESSYKPEAHRPRVESGYGTPLIFSTQSQTRLQRQRRAVP